MEPLKEQLYNKETLTEIAHDVKSVHPDFDSKKFLKLVFNKDWKTLELKERMRHCTICLHDTLNLSYKKAMTIISKAATLGESFARIIYSDYIDVYGREDLQTSIKALKDTTSACSSEFAIRYFIINHEQELLAAAKKWTKDTNEHIRRLASEGFRPRLPWGVALQQYKKDPKPILFIYEALKKDESLYVRKSVVNSLNDISKDNPVIFKRIMKSWYGKNKHTNWICKHASRTLLKQGDQDILAIFGQDKDIGSVIRMRVDKTVQIEKSLAFDFTVTATGHVRIEYAIYYKTKTKKSRKVFKIGEYDLKGDKHFSKKHSFKQLTTRKHHAGKHELAIIVNGREKKNVTFLVTD